MGNGVKKESPIYVQNISFKTHFISLDSYRWDKGASSRGLCQRAAMSLMRDTPIASHFLGVQTWPHLSSIQQPLTGYLLRAAPVPGLTLQDKGLVAVLKGFTVSWGRNAGKQISYGIILEILQLK